MILAAPRLERYPDKPCTSSRHLLASLVDGLWLAQLKKDGWRSNFLWDGTQWWALSRADNRLPISEAVLATLDCITVPPGTILDGEWMGRRAGVDERIWLFDILRLGAVWQNKEPAIGRFRMLGALAPAHMIVPHALNQYIEFYEAHQADPENEGIVLKELNSGLILSVRECADNPRWSKVKWRAGGAGQKRRF